MLAGLALVRLILSVPAGGCQPRQRAACPLAGTARRPPARRLLWHDLGRNELCT